MGCSVLESLASLAQGYPFEPYAAAFLDQTWQGVPHQANKLHRHRGRVEATSLLRAKSQLAKPDWQLDRVGKATSQRML
eukprot:3617520-Amphidinium_carterae.1